jgi:uncharacterized membrane protein YcaP (DUF421 family)
MNVINLLFGQGEHLNPLQMACRVLVIYLIALLWIRVAGRRAFGRLSTFDNVISILLGAILSRAVVGASPFLSIIVAGLVLVLLHRLVAWLCVVSHEIGKVIKGEPKSLYSNGKINKKNMNAHLVTHNDLMEEVRLEIHEYSLDNVEEIFIERNGEMSVIKKKE